MYYIIRIYSNNQSLKYWITNSINTQTIARIDSIEGSSHLISVLGLGVTSQWLLFKLSFSSYLWFKANTIYSMSYRMSSYLDTNTYFSTVVFSEQMQDSTENVVPPCDQLSDDKASDDSGDKCSSCGLLNCSCKSSHSPHPNDQPLDLSVHSRHKGSAINQIHSKGSETSDNENPLIKVPQPSTPTKAM